ncbi:MAG: DUF58 domain-containing protein, partial [Aquihabitans sp.]
MSRSGPAALPAIRRGFDRVGGSRLTGLGAVMVGVVAVGLVAPPQASDQQVVAVLWACLLALVVIGIAVPMFAVRSIRVEVLSPRDATVGDMVLLDVTVIGRVQRCEVRALDPTGPWFWSRSPGAGQVPHLADTRGLFQAVRVEVRVTAPLGILAAHRVHTIVLPYAVEVAPRPLAVSWLPALAPVDGHTSPVAQPALVGELVRSVRPYVSGDQAHLVHWPSSARLGSLVVRELEPPRPVGQAVVVDLRDLGAETDRAAAYALGAARAVLASGGELILATCEAGGPVVARVRT